MSTATLQRLLDYLTCTLSTSNMLWLSERLTDYAKKNEEEQLKPYTMEEIRARMEIAESESAAGLGIDSEEMIRELEAEFAEEDMKNKSVKV